MKTIQQHRQNKAQASIEENPQKRRQSFDFVPGKHARFSD
jgi:hypothetical protein